MKKFVFVVLHYMAIDDTIECIKSILNNLTYSNLNIVVVDNFSPDGSGEKLFSMYKDEPKVTVILNSKNEGFARGNNVGYTYAKDVLKADFIATINNDIVIKQKDFIEKCIETYNKHKYYLLGPDIISLVDNQHQNPHRLEGIKYEEIDGLKKLYKKEYLKAAILYYTKTHRVLKYVKDKVKKNKSNFKEKKKVIHDKLLENVQLHGAAIIFSPKYLSAFSYSFNPNTFMYKEEDILFYVCRKNDYKIIYNPEIVLFHKEDSSTNVVFNSNLKKRIFYYKNQLESLRILENLMIE